jgi:small conductance mechanosensitive channel
LKEGIVSFTPIWQQLQEMGNSALSMLPGILVGIAVFTLLFYAAHGIRALVERITLKRKRSHNLVIVLGRLTQGCMILLGLLIALLISFPSFKVVDLIQLLGISSVAIGFAFRDILQNFLAGILLLLAEPFRLGDQIISASFEGTVEDVQTRATTIRTYDGRRIVIPNSTLFTQAVVVNTAFEKRRLEYDLALDVTTDPERARKIILQAMRHLEGILPEPAPDALVVELNENHLMMRVRWWIQPPQRADALDTQDRVLCALKETLSAQDIHFSTQEIVVTTRTMTTVKEGHPEARAH